MVRFPEQDPRQLPEFPTTSLQQRWRVKQTEALTARRTWKSTQMGLVALCAQFKTFLTREFGEDYLSGMATEFEAVDLGATNSAPFVNAVRVLLGPSRDIQPPSAPSEGATEEQIEAYNTNLASYELAVENLKSYAGMSVPDAETANRIVTLVVKLRQYRQSAEEAGLESMQYAMESICLGEIPSAAILRDLSSNALAWKGKTVAQPIDFTSFGASSDNPASWNGQMAFHMLLVTPWLKGFKRDLITQEFRTYQRIRDSTTSTEAERRQYSWTWAFRTWAERAFNVKVDEFGYYRDYQGGRLYLGVTTMFYAKAYGRTAEPLLFWSTHSKYRLHATNMGAKGIVVELSEVDARIGAPSSNTTTVARFYSGTTGSAIAQVKSVFPYLMDVEEGNNPKLDKLIGETVSQQKITRAGAEFAKQPASARAGYKFVAATKTILAFPGTILYKPEFDSMQLFSSNIKAGFDSNDPEFEMWYAYSKKINAGASASNARMLRNKLLGVANSLGDTKYTVFASGGEKVEHGNLGPSEPFSWSKFLDKKEIKPLVKQCVLGVPNIHKDARVITSLSISLVPSHFETAIRQIEARLKEVSGSLETKRSMTGRDYQVPTDEWANLSNALIALTSGHWAMEGAWARTGEYYSGDYGGSTFASMGIPLSPTRTGRMNDGNANLKGILSVLKEYGVYDLSGIKPAFEGPVNDFDDVANIMSDFRKAYPDVSELVMPDTENPENLVLAARALHTNVTSLSVGKFVDIPKIAEGEYGSYMVRRVPINTKGVSGKTYKFGDMKSAMSNVMLSTNSYDMVVPSGMSGVSMIYGFGGLAAAGILTYALLPTLVGRRA